jgi:hypothetical protein
VKKQAHSRERKSERIERREKEDAEILATRAKKIVKLNAFRGPFHHQT